MRFLGPDADATDEIATFDQIPDTSTLLPVYAKTLTSDASLSTSSSTISGLTIAVPSGTYIMEGEIVFGSGGTFNLWFTPDFSGSFSNSQFRVNRMAGNAIVNTFTQTLGTEQATGTTTPQENRINGMFVATGSGNFTIAARRASSSTATMEKGSWVRLTKVA